MKKADLFDISSAEQLFVLLKAARGNFALGSAKRTQDLLFLVFGLAHLREWIAPGYKAPTESGGQQPKIAAEYFYCKIWDLPEYRIIKEICNRSKHFGSRLNYNTHTRYESLVDDWQDVDSVVDFDVGAPTSYFVNGRAIEEIIDIVMDFYERDWFSSPDSR